MRYVCAVHASALGFDQVAFMVDNHSCMVPVCVFTILAVNSKTLTETNNLGSPSITMRQNEIAWLKTVRLFAGAKPTY
jgi:hypothetical protein